MEDIRIIPFKIIEDKVDGKIYSVTLAEKEHRFRMFTIGNEEEKVSYQMLFFGMMMELSLGQFHFEVEVVNKEATEEQIAKAQAMVDKFNNLLDKVYKEQFKDKEKAQRINEA